MYLCVYVLTPTHKRISCVVTLTEIEGRTRCAEMTRRAGRLLPTAPTPREVSRLTPRGQLPRSKGDVTQRSVVTSYVARRRPLNTYRLAAGRLNYHLSVAAIALAKNIR